MIPTGTIVAVLDTLGQRHIGVVLPPDQWTPYAYDGVRVAVDGEAFWVGADQVTVLDVDAMEMSK